MLHFFRKIRRDLLANSKFYRYLKYGIGEIILVVIGILIAIQVDNWNEDRINRDRYEFGIIQLYKRIKARHLTWDLYRDRASFHLMVIDSLLNMPDQIATERVAPNLLLLEEFLNDDWINEDWFLDYLDFNPTDPIQFGVAQHLHRYFSGRYPDFKNWAELAGFESFKTLLIRENIPLCEFPLGKSLRDAIDDCANVPANSKIAQKLSALLHSDGVILKLQTLKKRRQEILGGTTTPEKSVLDFIEAHFGHLDLSVQHLEIAGSANPSGGASIGLPMQPGNADKTLWRLETPLVDGMVKFRTDENWTYEWGCGEVNRDKLVFKGGNILVTKGRYMIVVDLEKKTFGFTPVHE